MRQRKINVYSFPHLHAKVFAFDKNAFVGSANVSKHAANILKEAVLHTGDYKIRQAAIRFVKELLLEPLGPKELKRLQKLYRPPKFTMAKGKHGQQSLAFPKFRVASTSDVYIPEKLERAFEAGEREAAKKRKHNKGFYIEQFYWTDPSPFRDGQLIVEVYQNSHGRSVSPPGHVIHTRPFRNGKARKVLIYLELPDREWEPLSRFDKKMKTILGRSGAKNKAAAKRILAFWERRTE